MADVFCNACGHPNPTDANFCSSCGAGLATDRAEQPTIMFHPPADLAEADSGLDLEHIPAGMGLLVVQRGPGAGSRFALDTPVVKAGRHPDSDIFLDDVTVSRRHAELVRTADGYVVRDVGSLNGTYLNRERIDDEASLSHGDELQIGKFKLQFFVGTAAA